MAVLFATRVTQSATSTLAYDKIVAIGIYFERLGAGAGAGGVCQSQNANKKIAFKIVNSRDLMTSRALSRAFSPFRWHKFPFYASPMKAKSITKPPTASLQQTEVSNLEARERMLSTKDGTISFSSFETATGKPRAEAAYLVARELAPSLFRTPPPQTRGVAPPMRLADSGSNLRGKGPNEEACRTDPETVEMTSRQRKGLKLVPFRNSGIE